MAIDEAILTAVGEGEAPSTLRFYSWRSPWISLGSGERADDVDRDRIAWRGWGILRRASGGTAVIHQGQLGYAVILPSSHPIWRGDLIESYRRLAAPLAAAFRALGVAVEAAPPSARAEFARAAPPGADRICFAALGPYELLTAGHKVIGNSQVRRRLASLQHGTIQVSASQAALLDILAGSGDRERDDLRTFLDSHVGSLEAAAGRAIEISRVVEAIAHAIEASICTQLAVGGLTRNEMQRARDLVDEKYGNPEWTFRR
jgi:lipoate-protein ligase A